MRTLILFLATICMTSCAGDVYISYDASNDDVYYTGEDTTSIKNIAQKDTSDHSDYYNPETAQKVRWYELRSRNNDFDPFRYRYYIEDDQDGVGYKQRGCHIHENFDHFETYQGNDDDSFNGPSDESDDRDREYESSDTGRKR